MSNFFWKINRVRTMGLREVFWRAYKEIQSNFEKVGIGLAQVPPYSVFPIESNWTHDLSSKIDPAKYIYSANNILSGQFSVFALKNHYLGFPPNWNQDPKTLTKSPLRIGKSINYRDETIVGDIKYLWEPNRHLELVTLAQAWHLTKKRNYAFGFRDLLNSWFEQCPYPLGPNWTSSLEHSVRLVNWVFSWHLLGGDSSFLFEGEDGLNFKKRWIDSIYFHCHFIASHLSKYSSANNHLFGEYMGLFWVHNMALLARKWPLGKTFLHWVRKRG